MNKRKIGAALLATTMTVSAVSPALAQRDNSREDQGEVRIIVELEDEPLISYATRRGVKVSELDREDYEEMTDDLLDQQEDIRDEIEDEDIDIEVDRSFTNVINGFSATIDLDQLDEIEDIDGVERVSIVHKYTLERPDMSTSKDIVKTRETWADVGYTGEGTVIAIIDSGVDPDHQDMYLDRYVDTKIDEDDVEDLDLRGEYFSRKIPYGYNYFDDNDEIRELTYDGGEHGMHVAGTVGANGDEDDEGIKGIAPESQLLAMKVFSNDVEVPTTYGDIYIDAIDDAIALGADVINMSLGSTSEFVNEDDPEQRAVRRATENGIVMSISAGNSNVLGSGYSDVTTEMPDYGVVGSPGITPESLQVASIENTMGFMYYIDIDGEKAPYFEAGPKWKEYFDEGEDLEIVDCGKGGVESDYEESDMEPQNDFEDKDLEGKVALIERGLFNFSNKYQNAQDRGAIGVIVYNDEARGEGYVSMNLGDGDKEIPAMFIQHSKGVLLREEGEFEITLEKDRFLSPNKDKMSSFTSWGVTPNLDFKPEITAPGGQIYSTQNDDSYGVMSGTSMAAPHVSGGAALIAQRVNEEFDLEGEEKAVMIKNLLMSTAIPHLSKGTYNDNYDLGYYTSPRRQGAGVMDLYAASTTPCIVTDASTGISKVNLREIDEKFEFEIEITNFGDEDITYILDGQVTADGYSNGKMAFEPFGLQDEDENDLKPEFDVEDNEITVPAGDSVDVEVSIDIEDAITLFGDEFEDVFENGDWVEGFITLTDKADQAPQLSIPYVGFYGEWEDGEIIDEDNELYGVTGIYDGDDIDFDAVDEQEIDSDDMIDEFDPSEGETAQLVVSFIRNAVDLEVNIVDEDGDVVRALAKADKERKDYHDNGDGDHFTSYEKWEWDGSINGRVEAGEYAFQLIASIDYRGADEKVYEFPIEVEGKDFYIDEVDEDDDDKIDEEDTRVPIVHLENPTMDAFDSSKIYVDGSVEEDGILEELKVNGEDVYYAWDEDDEKYYFMDTIKLEDGLQKIKIEAVDDSGNDIEFERKVFIDTEAPDIDDIDLSVNKRFVDNDVDEVTIEFTVEDNYNDIEVYVSGNSIYDKEVDWTISEDLDDFEKDFEETIELEEGDNIISIRVVDIAGNETKEIVRKIYRRD